MAVTISQEPAPYSPSGNPLMYEFSSDQTAQANFSYIVETYVGGVQVKEEQVFLERATKAHIDIQETVDNLLSAPTVKTDFEADSGTSADIYIKVYENYGTPATNQASATSSTTVAFKGEISKERFVDVNFNTQYRVSKWLTNHPTNNITILREQTACCSILTDSAYDATISYYDSAGALITSYTTNQNRVIWQFNLTQFALIADTGVTQPQLDNTAYFTLQVSTSDILTFTYLDDYCYNPKSLLWVNEYGSFDTFIFNHNDIRKGSNSSKSYTKQFGAWDGTTFGYDPLDSGAIDYVKTQQIEGTLVSGYMTEEIHDFMVELYDSPFYLLYDAAGNGAESVSITSNSWNYNQNRFDELIMEEVSYKLSNTKKSVRR